MIFQDNTQFCLLYSDHETITYPKHKELFMSELLPGKTKTSWAVNAPQLGESLETLNQLVMPEIGPWKQEDRDLRSSLTT